MNRDPAKMAESHRISQEKYGYDGCGVDVDDATVAEACGAGDIFGGSALWKLLQLEKASRDLNEEELREVVQFACTAAGLSTTRSGGISSVPTLEEIRAVQ